MPKAKSDGGPAFPQTFEALSIKGCEGMTLRDYFAAKAMQSILCMLDEGIRPNDCIRAAEDSYFIADAMLKAREVSDA